ARERGALRRAIPLPRDLRRHAAEREGAAAMTGLDQLLRIGAQEGLAHHHVLAVRREEARLFGEALDGREDVVPAAAVEPDDIVAQLVEDLVHLERRRQR